ncbi:hypothetical protein BGZ91_008488, partial [Linnemannia elongata]
VAPVAEDQPQERASPRMTALATTSATTVSVVPKEATMAEEHPQELASPRMTALATTSVTMVSAVPIAATKDPSGKVARGTII